MKIPPSLPALLATLLAAVPVANAQIAPEELVAPKLEISGGNLIITVQPSVVGRNYWLQWSDSMAGGTWADVGVIRSGDGGDLVLSTPYTPGVPRRFFRVALVEATPAPAGFSLISAGSYTMGDQSSPLVGFSNELPVHSVNVSDFYMGKYEVTKEEWDAVRAWGLDHDYTDLPAGNGSFASKGTNHPVHSINWYALVKWCNARSQMEGLTPCYTVSGATYKTGSSTPVCNWAVNGYRLPSEAEWEKAARGGLSAQNFPWGNTISHNLANFWNTGSESYQTGAIGPHPVWSNNNDGNYPYSSPVGSFASNGYGLYDMAGNMWEWCWDWYGSYAAGSQTDPRGAASGSSRVARGGSWGNRASYCRAAFRYYYAPTTSNGYDIGFRIARSSVP